MERVVTIKEAVPLVGLTPISIRYFIRAGKIKAVKVGKNYVITESEIRRIQQEGIQ